MNRNVLSSKKLTRLAMVLVPTLLLLAVTSLGFAGTQAQNPIPDATLPIQEPLPPDDAPGEAEESADNGRAVAATAVTNEWGGAVWTAQGPGPSQNGQVENITPNQEVAGAIHTVAAHPTNADILYIGATNGGVWKTTNATNSSPNWTPLTDQQGSLSIGALEIDPLDVTSNTLVVGIGRYSSFGRVGGERTGLLRTTDGGATWTPLNGGGTLTGKNISGVAPRGSTIVASVNVADNSGCENIGVFHSTDTGASFTQLNNGSNGLPRGVAYDLTTDPTNANVLYTGIVEASCDGVANGVFKSTDMGLNWSRVSNATMEALIIDEDTSSLEFTVGNSGEVYAAIVSTGVLTGFFRSPNGDTGTWVQLDTPTTNEDGTAVGLNPKGHKGPPAGSPMADIAGGQGALHFSIRADNTISTTVYVGGDRQPRSNGDAGSFPNSINAMDFTGRIFRGDTTAGSGFQFVHLTHSNAHPASTTGGTASSSAPHADSREMVFDANGNIIEVDDGGVYRRTSPLTNTGDWFSINGDLQVTEIHDIAYDSNSNRLMSGNQDTGTTYQTATDGTTWDSWTTADGGDVAVDNITLAANNQSIRYASFQNLASFNRSIWDASGNAVSAVLPALNVLSGSALIPQFVTPIALNTITPTHLLIGGTRLYESTDQGENITEILNATVNTSISGGHMMVYGGKSGGIDNQYLIYAPASATLYVRTTMGGVLTPTATAFPGSFIRGIAANPTDWQQAYVADNSDNIYVTTDAGATTWTNVTGNLSDTNLRSVEATDTAVFVGGSQGLYMMFHSNPSVWYQVGTNLPTVPVWDIDYDATDDLLVIGTLGRGAWKLSNLTSFLQTPTRVKQCDIAASQNYPFNSLNTLNVAVTTLGDISCLTVDRTGSNHPNATIGLQTGQYWAISAVNSSDSAASGFTVDLTLPASFTPDGNDKVCRYTGTGSVWDCALSSSTSTSVSRNGVTQLSDWAAGDSVNTTGETRYYSYLSILIAD